MTRKHFNKIAQMFAAQRAEATVEVERYAIDGLILRFVEIAREDNPLFNEQRFLDAADFGVAPEPAMV